MEETVRECFFFGKYPWYLSFDLTVLPQLLCNLLVAFNSFLKHRCMHAFIPTQQQDIPD